MAAIAKEQIDALRKIVDVQKNERGRVRPALRIVRGSSRPATSTGHWQATAQTIYIMSSKQ